MCLSSLSCKFSLTFHCIYYNSKKFHLKPRARSCLYSQACEYWGDGSPTEVMVPLLSVAGGAWSLQGAAGGQGGAGVPQKVCRPHWAHSAGKSQRRHRLCRHPSIQGESGTDKQVTVFLQSEINLRLPFLLLVFSVPAGMWSVLTIEGGGGGWMTLKSF